jgi:hypothetical protein
MSMGLAISGHDLSISSFSKENIKACCDFATFSALFFDVLPLLYSEYMGLRALRFMTK